MTNESHTDWWNQYLKSDDPDHVVVQMDKEIELLRDQRDSNMAKEVERIASLTTQRDEYKVWWERDSTSLGKALNEVSSLRAVREESRAAIEQLHAAVKTAQELAATRLMEIEKLQMRLKRHEPVSLYNGHDIDWWKAEAERLRGAMQTIVSDGDYTAPEGMKRIAQAALSGSHEPSEQLNPFDSAAILAAPRERRISMSFETQEQYEAALVFLDMADEGASRDASPADLVGALQDVVHTDPGPVRAGRATREWHFDRYRGGKLMAQGVKVHAPNYADAYEKAVTMLFTDGNKPTDELRLSERTSEQL